MAMFLGAISMVLLICTGHFVLWGYDWLTIGHGLNPYLAFPMAALSLWLAYVVGVFAINLGIPLDESGV